MGPGDERVEASEVQREGEGLDEEERPGLTAPGARAITEREELAAEELNDHAGGERQRAGEARIEPQGVGEEREDGEIHEGGESTDRETAEQEPDARKREWGHAAGWSEPRADGKALPRAGSVQRFDASTISWRGAARTGVHHGAKRAGALRHDGAGAGGSG